MVVEDLIGLVTWMSCPLLCFAVMQHYECAGMHGATNQLAYSPGMVELSRPAAGCVAAVQVQLVNAAVDQLAEEGAAMWQRMHDRPSPPADASTVLQEAGNVAAAAAAEMAVDEAQEAGGTAAAASKLATAYVQAAGALSPESEAAAAGPQQPGLTQQTARQAAEKSSLSLLLLLPYCEVLCFVDLGDEALKGCNEGSKAHRWVHALTSECCLVFLLQLVAVAQTWHWRYCV
jgi:hypothetical protein